MNSFQVKSPANIALIKYWGMQDEDLILPANLSFSFNLSECYTKSTFEVSDKDSYEFEGQQSEQALQQIQRVRDAVGDLPYVRVVSENSFPASCGLASSASAFSALTYGLFVLATQVGASLEFGDLVELTRLSGSASAVRSLGDFFCTYDPSKPRELGQPGEWDLVDVVCTWNDTEKLVSSREGHGLADGSWLMAERLQGIPSRYESMLASMDDDSIFDLIEEETWSFLLNHITCGQPLNYTDARAWDQIRTLKEEGLRFGYTFDAGATLHLICRSDDAEQIAGKVECDRIFVCKPCEGAQVL